MRLRLAIATIASTWVTMAAALPLALTARASEPPPSECEGKPPSRDGFAPQVARRLTQLLHQAAAAVPRTGGDGLRVRFDEVPVIELRDACWKLPDDLTVWFERSLPVEHAADEQRLAVSVTLSVLPADHWVPGNKAARREPAAVRVLCNTEPKGDNRWGRGATGLGGIRGKPGSRPTSVVIRSADRECGQRVTYQLQLSSEPSQVALLEALHWGCDDYGIDRRTAYPVDVAYVCEDPPAEQRR